MFTPFIFIRGYNIPWIKVCLLLGLGDVTGSVSRAILSGKDYVRYVIERLEYDTLVSFSNDTSSDTIGLSCSLTFGRGHVSNT